jgi:ABC-type branched-subunit amino acid transport system substrate-binding protein
MSRRDGAPLASLRLSARNQGACQMGSMSIGRRAVLGAAAAATVPFARAGAAEPLLIAVATPMTGSSGAMGLNGNRGADIATAAINAAGGIAGRPVKFEIFDDRGAPKDAATVAQSIVDAEDKYFAVCGHVNSSATLAAMPIYADAGTPVLCPSSSNPAVTEQGWKNIIRLTGRDDYGAQEYSAFMINNLGKRKLGIFFVNNDFGRGLRNEIVKAVAVLKGEIVAEGTFTPNVDRDFQPVITQMKAAGVDGLMLMTEYTEGGLFLAQAKDLGFTGIPVAGPDSNLYDKYIELSLGNAEGTYVLAAFDPYADKPITKAFMTGYTAKYHELASQVAVFTHDIFWIIKDAVEKHGATRANLIDTVKGMTFDGVGGAYAWDAKGDTKNRTHFVLQVKGKEFVSTGIRVDETGLDVLRKS